jgi:Ca-activated chloride channel homolog
LTGTRLRVAARGSAKIFALLVVLGSCAESQVSPAANSQTPESYRVSVDVNLVVLNAAVRDRQGRFVSDLRQQDFEVYEDGVLQNIQFFQHEDVAVTVGLVVDHSSSMRPRLAHVITAAQSFVKFSNPEDQMFVVNFNERVSMGLPEAIRFSNEAKELGGAIYGFPVTGDKKVLLVISDGGDNASAHSLAQVTDLAGRSTAIIYTIGIFDLDDADRNPAVLSRLAQATGGEAFFPSQLSEVAAICERIARDIRNQYTIGYVPANAARNSAYRTIRVAAHRASGRLFVRTRAGYIAAGNSPESKKANPK